MLISDYQREAVATAIYGDGQEIIYPALGLGNEAGEVQGKVKKVLRDNAGVFDDVNKRKIADELGDVLWYCAALARDIGYDLDTICQINLNKLKDRQTRNVIQGSGDTR